MKADLITKKQTRSREQLKRLQGLPLEQKVNLSLRRIEQFYNRLDGKVYISFSGGKDSTVLLHLVRSLFPNVKAVFADTGLEFPEIRDFVKSIDNVEWVKPKMHFTDVIKKHGFPVISKEISKKIRTLQNPSEKNEVYRRAILEGITGDGRPTKLAKMPQKWLFMKDAPFKCSEKCCDIMKKNPLKSTEKDGLSPYIGTMADESRLRLQSWIQTGCNAFSGRLNSTPLSFWTEADIWAYIKSREIPYSEIYNMGYQRTGCIFCMFGLWAEPRKNNRFTQLEKTHPALHRYCMDKLGLREVIDWINQNLYDDQIDLF